MTKIKHAQVGGDHYEAPDGLQCWDVMERFDIAFLEARAVAYVVRWRRKGTPALDLGKAISFLDRIAQEGRGARRTVPLADLAQFALANELEAPDTVIVKAIIGEGYGTPEWLGIAHDKLSHMLAEWEKRR